MIYSLKKHCEIFLKNALKDKIKNIKLYKMKLFD